MDLDRVDSLSPSVLLRSYGKAERALGRLAHGLETNPLHQSWLWREITRVSVLIAQAGGYHAKVDQLRSALIGAPLALEDNTPGLAAARRVFLAATPLFRAHSQADSNAALWPPFWRDDGAFDDEDRAARAHGRPDEVDRAGEESHARGWLAVLVRDLAGFADDGRRPALINLFVDLREHAAVRALEPSLVRIVPPLALAEAGLVPKAAPGLLGGRRLPLGLSRAGTVEQPLTEWLKQALEALTVEADQSYRRLSALTSQHQAWHHALAKEGLRRHAKAPGALDLLAATPVLTIGLTARHLGCSHVAAGGIVGRLVDLGILIEQTSRSRHKVFVAGDLPAESRGEAAGSAPLSVSEPAALVDVDALGATLDGLFADLDRLNERCNDRVKEGAALSAPGNGGAAACAEGSGETQSEVIKT